MDFSKDLISRRKEWFRYYSEKRIGHQWLQVHLLRDIEKIKSVFEVGPGLGLVSSMLHNAGYKVTTLDYLPSQNLHSDITSVQSEIAKVSAEVFENFDCIICCETLEHLYWDDVDKILEKFYKSKVPWVILSVPYQGFQFYLRVYFNRYIFRQSFSLKFLKFLKKFSFDFNADPYGHKWEVGYRGYSVKSVEKKITKSGFKIVKREFSYPCRSIFFVLQNTSNLEN